MWIITTVILGLIALLLLGDNSILRKENEALKYINIYLSTKFKDNIDIDEIKRITDKYK